MSDRSIIHPDFHELFDAIQMQHVFPDCKTCCDIIPKNSLEGINRTFQTQKESPSFNLSDLISTQFSLPKIDIPEIKKYDSPADHVRNLWPFLERMDGPVDSQTTKIKLPYPYIVPGGRFQEMYYWDTFFTMQGFDTRDIDRCENLILNFRHYIETLGFIPNGNRQYFLSRSQPPFFGLMLEFVWSLAKREPLDTELAALEKELVFWNRRQSTGDQASLRTVHVNGTVLHRYFDESPTPRPESYREDVEMVENLSVDDKEKLFEHLRAACESGWDFSSRWCYDEQDLKTIKCADIIPIDLNCLLNHDARIINKYNHDKGGELKQEETWEVIRQLCWNDDLGIYCDYNFARNCNTGRATTAATFPLFLKLATEEEARSTSDFIEKHLLQDGGIVTTLVESGQQWDWPNGWAPLQFVAFVGLKNYGFNDLAHEIASRFCHLIEKTYNETGKMMEKYNVVDLKVSAGGGEYPNQDGFGWTNGVYVYFKKSLGGG